MGKRRKSTFTGKQKEIIKALRFEISEQTGVVDLASGKREPTGNYEVYMYEMPNTTIGLRVGVAANRTAAFDCRDAIANVLRELHDRTE